MPRRLVVAGIVVTGIGLALLAYLDPTIQSLFFGGSVAGSSSTTTLSRTLTFNVNFTNGPIVVPARGSGGTSLASAETAIVFLVAVIGLLLTIAGSFATGGRTPTGPGPAPAASSGEEPSKKKIPPVQAKSQTKIVIRDGL